MEQLIAGAVEDCDWQVTTRLGVGQGQGLFGLASSAKRAPNL